MARTTSVRTYYEYIYRIFLVDLLEGTSRSFVDVMSDLLVEICVALLSASGVKDSCLPEAAPDNGDGTSLLCGTVFAELGQEDGDDGWDDEQEAEYVERKQVAYEVMKGHFYFGFAAMLHVCGVVVCAM